MKKVNKKRKTENKKIILSVMLGVFAIILVLVIGITNISKLMGNSTNNNIIKIKVNDSYILEDNNVNICQVSNNTLLSSKIKNNKCILTGKKIGITEVEVFKMDGNLDEKSYTISVIPSIKITKRNTFNKKQVSYKVSSENMDGFTYGYCLNRNGVCSIKKINSDKYINVNYNNSLIYINNIPKTVNKVCVYAYDEEQNLVSSECTNRGFMNRFW